MKASRPISVKSRKRKTAKSGKTRQSFSSLLAAEAQPLVIVSLVTVVFLCYANSLGNEFVFDDIYLVQVNQQIRNLDLSLLLNSYRPLRDFSYAIDFALWGERPVGFHLTNIMVHAANVVLVFTLVRRLTKDLVSAAITALIFAVHPMQTDAVTYISGRRDILFTLFYLLSFHSYVSYYRTRWSTKSVIFFVLFFVFMALSLLSKEMGASLPILIFVWHYCDAWEETGSWWQRLWLTARNAFAREKLLTILVSAAGIAYAWYWVFIHGASRRASLGKIEYWGGSFYLNILTVIRVHAWYLKQLVYPTPIAQYLGAFEVSETLFDWRLAVALPLVGGVLLCGFLLLNRDKLMAFAILSYFVLLLPVSQIIPHHELLADHYLYLPIMSFGLFVALLIRRLGRSNIRMRKALYFAAGVVVIIFAVMTIIQNGTWKNERTLWTANYKAVPHSPRAALNLGNTYQDTEPERAEQLFKRALSLNPPPELRRTLYDRLTVILIEEKKLDEAEFFASEVLKKSPNDFFGNLWMSQIHILRKDCDKARTTFLLAKSVAGNPRETQLSEQAGRLLEQQCPQ